MPQRARSESPVSANATVVAPFPGSRRIGRDGRTSGASRTPSTRADSVSCDTERTWSSSAPIPAPGAAATNVAGRPYSAGSLVSPVRVPW